MTTINYVTAADVLDLALRRHGVTQTELCRRTGISPKGVSFLLSGKNRFSPRSAALCQQALGCSTLADQLLVAQAHVDAAEAVAALRPDRPIR